MSYPTEKAAGRTASIISFLLTITLSILFLIYFTMMVYTKDALWFYPVFDAMPDRIGIRCYGEEVTLGRDSEHLGAIANLVNTQISGDKRWDELNLTDQTYQDYQTSDTMLVLELFYDEPQRIHSSSPFFSNFNSLLIPLDGRYSNTNIMFALVRGKPSGSSFHITSFEPVKAYITEHAICIKP